MRHRLALFSAVATAFSLIDTATAVSATATPAPSVVINEVESNGDAVGDWVELHNTDISQSVDISGWSLIDGDASHTPITFPAGTVIESGGYFAFYTDTDSSPDGNTFGLGGKDSVTLSDATGAQVDSVSWTEHATTTLGRTDAGAIEVTSAPTRGLRNDFTPATPNTPEDAPFSPAGLSIKPVELSESFAAEDFSGADVDAAGRAWVVNNDKGELYALDFDEATGAYSVAGHWQLRYADGTGEPDAEGVTVTDEGIYVATERDNATKTVSRPSILRFDVPSADQPAELTATNEWNLVEFTGTIGANGGPEAIEFDPATGTFAVGIESTAEVMFLKLDRAGNKATLTQRIAPGFEAVASLNYEDGALRISCDDACEGRSAIVGSDGTLSYQARPTGIDNLATEGFASFATSCGTRYLWADDGATLGSGILAAQTYTSPCKQDTQSDDQGAGSSTSVLGIVAVLGVIGALIAALFNAFPQLPHLG